MTDPVHPGSLSLVPAVVTLVAAAVWLIVLSRMTNLGIALRYRLGTLAFAVAMLWLSFEETFNDHLYRDGWSALKTNTLRTVVRAAWVAFGIAFYRVLGKAYPARMAASPKEPWAQPGTDLELQIPTAAH